MFIETFETNARKRPGKKMQIGITNANNFMIAVGDEADGKFYHSNIVLNLNEFQCLLAEITKQYTNLMTYKPHQERAVEERRQLNDKVVLLSFFIESNSLFHGLNDNEKCLLVEQLHCMKQYLAILDKRIDIFDQQNT